jgi:hypothetical protein
MQVAVLKWLRARERAQAAVGKTFHSLATYNFRLFFIGQLISNTGNQLTNVTLILFVLQLSHSGLAVGHALGAGKCQGPPNYCETRLRSPKSGHAVKSSVSRSLFSARQFRSGSPQSASLSVAQLDISTHSAASRRKSK